MGISYTMPTHMQAGKGIALKDLFGAPWVSTTCGFWISRMRISMEEIKKGLEDGSVRMEPPEGITII